MVHFPQHSSKSIHSPSAFRDRWAKTRSPNRNVKVYLGAPAGPKAAGSGYVDANELIAMAKSLQDKYSSFGGVMLWDADTAFSECLLLWMMEMSETWGIKTMDALMRKSKMLLRLAADRLRNPVLPTPKVTMDLLRILETTTNPIRNLKETVLLSHRVQSLLRQLYLLISAILERKLE